MKERYIVKVKNLSTGVVRVREMLLDEKQAARLKSKISKPDGGFLLIDMWQ